MLVTMTTISSMYTFFSIRYVSHIVLNDLGPSFCAPPQAACLYYHQKVVNTILYMYFMLALFWTPQITGAYFLCMLYPPILPPQNHMGH